jgi:hypothetical protein
MGRDSFFGDRVVWTGRPKRVLLPPLYRWGAIACAVIALTTTLSAFVVSTVLSVPSAGLLLFAAWMATMALAFWRLPLWWRSEEEYTITEKHIIVRRGRYRRFMERHEISFARINWDKRETGIGDLELVRAVPTGALRRRIALTLSNIAAPDRVWAFVRGVTPAAPAGDGHRLLAQRLDEGERVLWSSHPAPHWTRWVPQGMRGRLALVLGLTLVTIAFLLGIDAIRNIRGILEAGLEPASASFIALVSSLTLSVSLLGATAFGVLYGSLVRPMRLERLTRYLITDRRVLISRGQEELHLDRERIVDVIDTPVNGGLRHLFLVLDGRRARAYAASGAFGEEHGGGLQPVLKLVEDPEAVQRILKTSPTAVAA